MVGVRYCEIIFLSRNFLTIGEKSLGKTEREAGLPAEQGAVCEQALMEVIGGAQSPQGICVKGDRVLKTEH